MCVYIYLCVYLSVCVYVGLLRENPSGVRDLLSQEGLTLLLSALDSGIRKLAVKTLFLVANLFTDENTGGGKRWGWGHGIVGEAVNSLLPL